MRVPSAGKPSLETIGPIRRKAVSVSTGQLVKTGPLEADRMLPLLIEPAIEGVDLAAWAEGQRDFVAAELLRHGGLLFRGFNIDGLEEFERFIRVLAEELLDYTYRSTPRTQLSGKIYTSTEYPADQTIPFHNEMSYSRSWPLKIWFCCITPPGQGGETPIADSRRVYQQIPAQVREEFERKLVMYVRNYGGRVDLPWQEVFQTSSRTEVEEFCRHAGIELEWLGEDRLRTRQVCQAVAHHPRTGERVWFNQAHLFHVSSLPAEVRQPLLAEFGEENLSRNTCFGDGSLIEPAALDEVRRAYELEAVRFPWRRGDVLMLDNMLVAHGREPFSGLRKIVVGMADPVSQAP
jgi:alpha-ketoglutarate-dependent taurine dioxygenase